MKKENIPGVLTLVSVIILTLLLLVINSQGKAVQSFYIKSAMVMLVALVVFAGTYLVTSFCIEKPLRTKKTVYYLGVFILLFAILVCFNILPFDKLWNILIISIVLFVLFVQLILLNWGERSKQIIRFFSLFVILSDLFLIFFFIALWQMPELKIVLYTTSSISVILTILGMLLIQRSKSALKS